MLNSFVVAMIVTMALIPVLMRASHRLGMVDRPEPRKVHLAVVPRVGGLAMLAGLLVSLVAIESFSRPVFGMLAGILIVATEGAWDDMRPLGYIEKFAAQVLAALCVVLVGGLEIRQLVLFDPVLLPSWVSIPLTVVVIVALTNAINLADGLDGLAGGVSFFCCTVLAVLAYVSGNSVALFFATALCGAILGFLRFNTHPAVVFMGDGGSQLLGLGIASLAILVTQSETSVVSATTPLFLLAIPLLDTLFVMVSRVREGRSPFAADRNHLHHRLLTLGCTQAGAVTLIYLAQALMIVLAYLLRFESDITNVLVFGVLGSALLFCVSRPRRPIFALLRGRYARRKPDVQMPVDLRPVAYRTALLTLRAAIALYFALGAFTLDVPADVAILLAAMLFALLTTWRKAVSNRFPLIEKVVSYAAAGTLAYLFVSAPGWTTELRVLETAVVAAIAMATVATLRLSDDGAFRLTTMDVLVLFTAIVIPNLPGETWSDTNLAGLAARTVVLLYALEVVLNRSAESGGGLIRVTTALTIGVLAIKGVVAVGSGLPM